MDIFSWIFLYLDPYTGSLLVQFVIAAISGIIIFFKQIKVKIKNIVNFLFGKKQGDEE